MSASSAAKSPAAVNDGDLAAIVSEQRRELSIAEALESDWDLAFRLQMEEALAASAAFQPSSSTTKTPQPPSPTLPSPAAADPSISGVEVSTIASLQALELDRFEQERFDGEQSKAEMSKIRADLDRFMHDREFATEIMRIPNEEWDDYGDDIECPFGEGPSRSEIPFRLYFKGLVSDEKDADSKMPLSGIGVAICDPMDNPIFELSKPLVGNGGSKQGAELRALIEALNTAVTLDLKRVTLYCDYFPLYQQIIGRWPAKQRKIQDLVNQVHLLRAKFAFCNPALIARKDIKFAFKLARDAIVFQVTKSAGSSSCKTVTENCVICLEDMTINQMFTIVGCHHRYCYSCMKQHVEVKLLHGMVPKCPHDSCKSELDIQSCGNFLTPRLLEMMKQRIKEAAIPVTEKVYCPYLRCSALMTRSEVTDSAREILAGGIGRSGVRKCQKCHKFFCIDCKVPWHNNMTCFDYKKLNPFPRGEDAKLKSLATKNLWRQCVKCNHMIELAEGCFHMTCRCGYEFCYTCGAEWKNKNATCKCPLWDEDNILYDDDEEDEEDVWFDEDYDNSDSDDDEEYGLAF